MKRNFKNFLIPLTAILFSACSGGGSVKDALSRLKDGWDGQNNPLRVNPRFEKNYHRLPTTGIVSSGHRPWSDTYWPNFEGGIAARWYQTNGDDAFSYLSPSEAEARAMTRDQLARLSPAEKYDIYMGRFDYPTVAAERRRVSPDDEGWEGLCHGWVHAALQHAEPRPVDVAGPSGIVVPFGSSDVKALLTYYYGYIKQNASSRFIGIRCNADLTERPEFTSTPACRDTNAGAFHILMSNQIGIAKEGFVLDVNRDRQVWNQPAISYQSMYAGQQAPSPGAAVGTVKEILINTRLRYAAEISPTWNSVVGSDEQSEIVEIYKYRLELDANNDIVGGEWLQDKRPDFLWITQKLNFEGYWEKLSAIYQAVY